MGKISARKIIDVTNQLDLDNCESYSEWTAGTDTSALASSTSHKTGAKSVSFAKSGTTGITGSISKTLNSKDGHSFAIHKLKLNIYLSSLTNVASVSVNIGEDASNYNTYTLADTYLSTGWNELNFDCDSETSVTGDGINWASINYLEVVVTFDAGANTLTGILVDTVYLYKSNGAGSPSAYVNVEELGGEEIPSTLLQILTDGLKYPDTIFNSQKTVTSAGTAEQVVTTAKKGYIILKALDSNTNNVYAGNSSVSSANGFVLDAGESITLSSEDISDWYIDTDTNGEGVSVIGAYIN